MGNLLDTSFNGSENEWNLPTFPDKRDRYLEVQDIREGLIDTLEFKKCNLLALIAERNSILGKVMPHSQRLIYEITFLSRLQTCREKLIQNETTGENEFVESLDSLIQLKRETLPRILWNAIYHSDEMQKHFSHNRSWLNHDMLERGDHFAEIKTTLDHFASLVANSEKEYISPPEWLGNIEDDYFILYRSEFGSELLFTLNTLTIRLNQITSEMQKKIDQSPLCQPKRMGKKRVILKNIFLKFYLKDIQPYISRVDQVAGFWFEKHNFFIDSLPSTAPMLEYQHAILSSKNKNSLYARWHTAHKKHTKAWQQLLKQCQLTTESLAEEIRVLNNQ